MIGRIDFEVRRRLHGWLAAFLPLLLLALVGLPAAQAMGWLAPREASDVHAVSLEVSRPGEILVAALPPEGRQTLVLIKRGGPFPYAKDGTVFGNREGLLPRQERGYYREYTVPTPGLNHRGARRIVAGERRDYWYTADHYRSFRRIRE